MKLKNKAVWSVLWGNDSVRHEKYDTYKTEKSFKNIIHKPEHTKTLNTLNRFTDLHMVH